MRLEYTERQQRFREEVRAWLERNVPRQPLQSFDTEAGFAEHRACAGKKQQQGAECARADDAV